MTGAQKTLIACQVVSIPLGVALAVGSDSTLGRFMGGLFAAANLVGLALQVWELKRPAAPRGSP